MACILIAEDDEYLAQLMLGLLPKESHEVVVASSVAEALRIVQQVRIDLVIAEASLIQAARQEGEALCHAFLLILRPSPLETIPIIILASESQRTQGWEALAPFFQPGLDRLLVKPFTVEELASSVAQLLPASQPSATLSVASDFVLGPLILATRSYSVALNGQATPLTPIEFGILHFLMFHSDEVVSSELLLKEVWGYPPGTAGPDLVRVHIKNLRAKLDSVAPAPLNIIQTVPRRGYFIPEDNALWTEPSPDGMPADH